MAGPQMPAAERTRLVDQVRRVYKDLNYQLIWIDGESPSARYRAVREGARRRRTITASARAVSAADRQSTRERREDFRRSRHRARRSKPRRLSYVTSSHLAGGRLDPRALQSLWTLKPEKPDLVAALTAAVKNNDLAAAMETLAAAASRVSRASESVSCVTGRSRRKGGWPSIPGQHAAQAKSAIPGGADAAPATGNRRRLDPSHEKDPSPIFERHVADA